MSVTTSLLLLGLGLVSAGRPTSGLEVGGMFVYGTEDGEVIATSPREPRVFALSLSDRPVFVAHGGDQHLVIEDELGGVIVVDSKQRRVLGPIHPSTPGRGDGLVVVTTGQVYLEAPGGLFGAHSLETRRLLWKTEARGLASDGKSQLYGVREAQLMALAPSTGKPLYSHPMPGLGRSAPAVDADGVVATYAVADRKKKGRFIYGLAEWPHEADAKPRFVVPLPDAPVAAPVICGASVGVLLESSTRKETKVFARFDRLDGRLVASDELPSAELELRCAGDLFVAQSAETGGHRRISSFAASGSPLWSRTDLDGFVGRFGDRFFAASGKEDLVPLSAEIGAVAEKGRVDIAAEITPLPPGAATRRFLTSGETLELPAKTQVSIRLRIYRGAVLEPSVSVIAEDEVALPPGLRLSRDGLLFGRARGLGLHVVPLMVALPGHPNLGLSIPLRLVSPAAGR